MSRFSFVYQGCHLAFIRCWRFGFFETAYGQIWPFYFFRRGNPVVDIVKSNCRNVRGHTNSIRVRDCCYKDYEKEKLLQLCKTCNLFRVVCFVRGLGYVFNLSCSSFVNTSKIQKHTERVTDLGLRSEMIFFLSHSWPLLKRASFFEAAGAKMGLSLFSNAINQVKLFLSLIHSVSIIEHISQIFTNCINVKKNASPLAGQNKVMNKYFDYVTSELWPKQSSKEAFSSMN